MVRNSKKRQTTLSSHHQQTSGIASCCFNVGAYRRLSADDKKKRGDSLETQQNIIENYIAASPDIRLVETYTDNNATGTNFDRPGFQKMLADIESGKINCIIVKDLSRFGRNAIDAGYYLEKYLPTLGVRFIAITDSYDSLDGDAGILLPLKNIISESYALDISRKCRSVQRQNISEGRFVGRLAPYGYTKAPDDCHKLIICEETAPIVRLMFKWAYNGDTVGEIARRLGDMNIPTPGQRNHAKGLSSSEKLRGNPYWKICTVKDMLMDRVYIGDMVQGKTRSMNNKKSEVKRRDWICVPNTHEPIISKDVFEKIQSMRNESIEKAVSIKTTPYTHHVLKGKVFCARCGYPLHRHKQANHDYYWYRCESQWKYGKSTCVQVSVKESDLKTEILTLLHRHAEAILGRYITFEKSVVNPSENSLEAELREINNKLSQDGRMRQSLYENMVSGLITREEFVDMKSDYETKIAVLSRRADEIRDILREMKEQVSEYHDLADAVSAAICDDTLTAEIINRLVDRILVHPDKSFEITFKFKDEFGEVLRCG